MPLTLDVPATARTAAVALALMAATLTVLPTTASATAPGASGPELLYMDAADDEGVNDRDEWRLFDPLASSSRSSGFAPNTFLGLWTNPAWSPDGRSVAYVDWPNPPIPNGEFSYNPGPEEFDVFVVPVSGGSIAGAPVRLTDTPANEFDVAWSPVVASRKRLAYTKSATSARTGQIWITDDAGRSHRQLTTGSADANADWSPEGSRIAYSSVRNGNRDIYVRPADGGDAIRVTTSAAVDDEPSWSPDGTRLVYKSAPASDPSAGELRVVDAVTRVSRVIAPGFRGSNPAWSPDGEAIAFETPDGGYHRLAFTRPDGGPVRLGSYGLAPAWHRVNRSPVAAFSVSPDAPRQGDTVTLTSTATDPDGPLWRLQWDLDDDGQFDDGEGRTRTVKLPATRGRIEVKLLVTDQDGATAIHSQRLGTAHGRPTASFAVNPAARGGDKVTLSSASTDPGRGARGATVGSRR